MPTLNLKIAPLQNPLRYQQLARALTLLTAYARAGALSDRNRAAF